MLGKWAIIDLETTGPSPGEDQIIDVGFLKFSGTDYIGHYSSLVRVDQPLSPFIQKLTGITDDLLQKAPLWSALEPHLAELQGHTLVAHNASFEKSFLDPFFTRHKLASSIKYVDSIPFFALLNPSFKHLSLEHLLLHYKAAEKEQHRGLADSMDLLKVLLLAVSEKQQTLAQMLTLKQSFSQFTDEYWFKHFLAIDQTQLNKMAQDVFQKNLELLKLSSELNAEKPLSKNDFASSKRLKSLREKKLTAEVVQQVFHQATAEGLRPRKSQLEMALKVGQSLKNEIHALIQAPTGTGKTLAYLVPSALYALEKKQTVLISTGTKVLQEQIYQKDLPLLMKLLGEPHTAFPVTRLLGSQNHLCELMFREEQKSEAPLELSMEDSAFEKIYPKVFFEQIFDYNAERDYDQKLTRDDLPWVIKKTLPAVAEWEQKMSVDYKSCVGSDCPFASQCSYIQGLRRAKESSLIIANHALMLNWPKSIEKPQVVIVDEAHKIEHEATKAFGVEWSVKSLIQAFKSVLPAMGSALYLTQHLSESQQSRVVEEWTGQRQQWQQLLGSLEYRLQQLAIEAEVWFKKSPKYTPQHMNERLLVVSESMEFELASLVEILKSILQEMAPTYLHLQEMQKFMLLNFGELETPGDFKAKATFDFSFGLFEKHWQGLQHALTASATDWVHTFKYSEEAGLSFESLPIDVGVKIFEHVLAPAKSVVFTSATLSNAQGNLSHQSLEWMTGYSYLPAEKRYKKGTFLPPQFEYEKQAKVFLVQDSLSLYDANFIPELIEKIEPIILALRGKTLILLSSRARFELAVHILLKEFDHRLPVFVQGLGKTVVEDFKKAQEGILVGMESFGEGIDIPGDQLRFLVIDKIPDLRQDLIIQKRREWYQNKFGNEFQDYFLAQRARQLQQKCGRLIRKEDDSGCILIIDQRTQKWKGVTWKSFAQLMEPYAIQKTDYDSAIASISSYFQVEGKI